MTREQFFTKLKTAASWDVPVAISRKNPLPIDLTSVQESVSLMEAYIKSNPIAHPGQLIVVLGETETAAYLVHTVGGEGKGYYKLAATTGSGDVAEQLNTLATRVSSLESQIPGINTGISNALSKITTTLQEVAGQVNFKAKPQINGKEIATEEFTIGQISEALAGITEFNIKVLKENEELPTTGVKGTFYFKPHRHGDKDIYDEYVWVNTTYEKIGNTDIDLSNYVAKTDVKTTVTAEEANPVSGSAVAAYIESKKAEFGKIDDVQLSIDGNTYSSAVNNKIAKINLSTYAILGNSVNFASVIIGDYTFTSTGIQKSDSTKYLYPTKGGTIAVLEDIKIKSDTENTFTNKNTFTNSSETKYVVIENGILRTNNTITANSLEIHDADNNFTSYTNGQIKFTYPNISVEGGSYVSYFSFPKHKQDGIELTFATTADLGTAASRNVIDTRDEINDTAEGLVSGKAVYNYVSTLGNVADAALKSSVNIFTKNNTFNADILLTGGTDQMIQIGAAGQNLKLYKDGLIFATGNLQSTLNNTGLTIKDSSGIFNKFSAGQVSIGNKVFKFDTAKTDGNYTLMTTVDTLALDRLVDSDTYTIILDGGNAPEEEQI